MKCFATKDEKQERRDAIRRLCDTPAEHIAAMGEESVLRAFNRAAEKIPAYRAFLNKSGVDARQINSIEAYRALAPILDKNNIFGETRIRDLCIDGNIDGLRSIMTSSGHSGIFSFGVSTTENMESSSQSIDTGLQYFFNVDERSTLLINALPMGVKFNTRAAVLAETSVRDDMVCAIVTKFASEFDQIVIVGEGSFIKKIVEDGKEVHGIDWPSLPVHFIIGEEGIAENYRTYLGSLIGITDFDDPESKLVISSMGLAELDLNIFHETRESIRIRRLAHGDSTLRQALFGHDYGFCPMFFVYYPDRCYVEGIEEQTTESELVISMLSQELKIPLLRYRSGDYGKEISYNKVVEVLRQFRHPIEPELKLPFVAVSGRGKSLSTDDGLLYPEAVKEALYADHRIAALATGNFRLTGKNGKALIEFQLRKGKKAHATAVDDFLIHLAEYSNVSASVDFYSYSTFPYAMELDWERKFSYL
jgi:phenylacetate-CoA ligase